MAPTQTKRQSRKRRKARPAPGAVIARPERAQRPLVSDRDERRRNSSLGTFGERPPSPFGGIPVSEIAIFVGAIGVFVGLFGGPRSALIVGAVVCGLGVVEFTAREHFSGYRSHATLLAAVPVVAILAVAIELFGKPDQRTTRELLLLAALPVFALAFWALRKRFRAARQSRVVRPPGA